MKLKLPWDRDRAKLGNGRTFIAVHHVDDHAGHKIAEAYMREAIKRGLPFVSAAKFNQKFPRSVIAVACLTVRPGHEDRHIEQMGLSRLPFELVHGPQAAFARHGKEVDWTDVAGSFDIALQLKAAELIAKDDQEYAKAYEIGAAACALSRVEFETSGKETPPREIVENLRRLAAELAVRFNKGLP